MPASRDDCIFGQCFLALIGRIQLEGGCHGLWCVAKQRCFEVVEIGVPLRLGHENLAEILVNCGHVVDQQDASVHRWISGASMGMSRVKVAPCPEPSLCAVRLPPISCAASTQLCRPKPCPLLRVVNPCEKM